MPYTEKPHSLIDGLAAVLFIGVMLTGAWQFIRSAQQIDWSELPLAWTDIRQGKTTGTVEKQLDENLPGRAMLIAAANSLRYLLLRGGGEQVHVGREGWLFLTEELRFHADAEAKMAVRVDLLAAAASALGQMNVKLVIALVPDKARVYPQYLASGKMPDYTRARYQAAINALQSRDVHVVDLLGALRLAAENGDVYYRSDTHWNQAGAQVAAKAVAAKVVQLDGTLGTSEFVTEVSTTRTQRPGDLLKLMGLDHAADFLRPPVDAEPVVTTRQTAALSTDLFGDEAVPVVLTGTSYSLRGNFHGFLQQALASEVLNTAKDGGGLLGAATSYLKDAAFRSSKPRVLVWEIPERLLAAELKDEANWLLETGLRH